MNRSRACNRYGGGGHSEQGWGRALVILVCAWVAAPAAARAVDLIPYDLEVCEIDEDEMQVRYRIGQAEEPSPSVMTFTLNQTVVDQFLATQIDPKTVWWWRPRPVGPPFCGLYPPPPGTCTGNCATCDIITYKGGKFVVTFTCSVNQFGCGCWPDQVLSNVKPKQMAAGNITVTIDLDVFSAVPESDESNNTISLMVDALAMSPCPTGACCAPDGACTGGTYQALCEAAGGKYGGDGSVCASAGCALLGACCTDFEGCVPLTSPGECECIEGMFLGAGVPCDADNDGIDDACVQGIPAASPRSLGLMAVLVSAAGMMIYRKRRPRAA